MQTMLYNSQELLFYSSFAKHLGEIWIGSPPTGQLAWVVSLPVGYHHLHYYSHLLLLISPIAHTHFTVQWTVEGWVDLCTAVRLCSLCARLYVIMAVIISTTAILAVWFEPGFSHTAVRHVTTKPLQPVLTTCLRLLPTSAMFGSQSRDHWVTSSTTRLPSHPNP